MPSVPLFGTASVLVAGQLQLALPPKCSWWFIQNQSTSPLKVTFISQDWGNMTSIVLNPAPETGAAGGYLDSLGMAYFGEQGVLLTSPDPVAAFGSGASPNKPPTGFFEAADGPTSFS